MPTTKKSVSIYVEDELYARIASLATEQNRSVSNFIAQFLAVKLSGDFDRNKLISEMNPGFVEGLKRAAARFS